MQQEADEGKTVVRVNSRAVGWSEGPAKGQNLRPEQHCWEEIEPGGLVLFCPLTIFFSNIFLFFIEEFYK